MRLGAVLGLLPSCDLLGEDSAVFTDLGDLVTVRKVCPPLEGDPGVPRVPGEPLGAAAPTLRVLAVLGPTQLSTQRNDFGAGCIELEFTRFPQQRPPPAFSDFEFRWGLELVRGRRVLRERVADCGLSADPGEVVVLPLVDASGAANFDGRFPDPQQLNLEAELLFEGETEPVVIEVRKLQIREVRCDAL